MQKSEEQKKADWKFVKIVIAIILGALFLRSMSDSGPSTPAPSTPAPAATPATFQYLTGWNNSVDTNTEPFTITGSRFKVIWSAEPQVDYGGHFSILLYSTNGNELLDGVINDIFKESKSGESIIYNSGEFYLDIKASNIKYNIRVEDYK